MNEGEPDDLRAWSLHCFCLGARSTPHRIIAADGNGRLLLMARHGIVRQDLSEFEALETRLALLAAYDLVRIEGEIVRAAFPILGIEESRHLDKCAGNLADRHIDKAEAFARTIAADLAGVGLARSREAMIFGHVLDGLTWTVLAKMDALPDTGLSIDHPYWNGAFWARYPRPAETGGTNEVHAGNATLVMVWVDANAAALSAIGAAPATWQALKALPVGAKSMELLGMRIPVVSDEAPPGSGEGLARLAAECILEGTRELESVLANIDPKIRTVIFGHDLIWALAERLHERGVLRHLRDILPAEAVFARIKG